MRRAVPLTIPSPIMQAVASAILVMAVLLVLTACATTTPTVDVQTVCLPLKAYTAAEDADLKKAYDALPKPSPLRTAIQDFEAMRDADRACEKGQK